MKFRIKIPATTANIGAGFDSIGIALNLYLELEVEKAKEWLFVLQSSTLKGLPTNKENYIFQTAKTVALRYGEKELPACKVTIKSEIPLARGLGSSSTAVVAGIELANQLLGLSLTKEEKADLATEIEGHPDNVAPAIYGGCVIGHVDETFEFVQVPIDEELLFIAAIPNFELETAYARSILPADFPHAEAVKASSVANVSVAAICQKDWDLLGKMIEKDLFHQSQRKALVPDYDLVVSELKDDVYGVYLSGAGPTMIALAPDEARSKLSAWKQKFPQLEWKILKADNKGMRVEYVER